MKEAPEFTESGTADRQAWPPLPYLQWRETCENLRLCSQVVGKIRLAQTPWLNHSWHATLYPTARGLTTGVIPCETRFLQVDFDFIDHRLVLRTSDGAERGVGLAGRTIADFHAGVLAALESLGMKIRFHGRPSEIENAIPFAQDDRPRAYDPVAVQRFWRTLLQAHRVFEHFRTGFLGKASPVHFFWGSFDLAVTRFSGRTAPPLPNAGPGLPLQVAREAYSHEVCSAGFWPGNDNVPYPAFYCYAYPEPAGFSSARVIPQEALYDTRLGEFLLPYEAVRSASSPDQVLLSFLQSTYDAAADRGGWDRAALDCPLGEPGVPRSAHVPGS